MSSRVVMGIHLGIPGNWFVSETSRDCRGRQGEKQLLFCSAELQPGHGTLGDRGLTQLQSWADAFKEATAVE